jgi:type II secretion system protein J
MKRRSGFTLIEMLAVMLLMGILVTAVVNFYLQLSRESNAAAATLRGPRRATAAMDRIARELESAILVVRPEGMDPLEHPWVFFAENTEGGAGADRLRFTTRGHRPKASSTHESDLAVVTYALREGPAGDLELVRWSAPRLPEALDRDVPRDDDEGVQVLVGGVAEFGLRFLSEAGEWKDAWDSSSLVDSNQLPLATEIRVALSDARTDADRKAGIDDTDSPVRRVIHPVRPLDLETLLSPDADEDGEADPDEDEDGDGIPDSEQNDEDDEEGPCVTVTQCVAQHPEIDINAALAAAGLPPSVVGSVGPQCASDFAGFAAIPGDCQ